MKKFLAFLMLVLYTFLIIVLFIDKKPQENVEIIPEKFENSQKIEEISANNYINGVFVATAFNLDFPSSSSLSSAEIQTEIDSIVENSKAHGITDIFFQVRPTADAFYYSNIFPPSVYLTGNQEKQAEFDILQYFLDKSHQNNMKLHAWINPYRITKTSEDKLCEKHIALQNSEFLVKHSDGNLYFNPAYPEVTELICDGVMEILENYDVDGIHLDDYFYPSTDFDDVAAYKSLGNDQELSDWRRDNVTSMISSLYSKIKAYDESILFGVSPAGIWANDENLSDGSKTSGTESYFSHYADSKKWVELGILDYIAPQIYWKIGDSVADYQTLTDWWSDITKDSDVSLYICHANYKEANGEFSDGEIDRQMQKNKENSNINGSIFFRYEYLDV